MSLVVRNGERLLLVQRPADDEELPNVWGLPAASLRDGESWEEAVERTGRDKLGVDVKTIKELRRGSLQRPRYTLEMRLYEAHIADGNPSVPQPYAGVTQYQAWKWGEAQDLAPAAKQGSLCSRLYLELQKRTGKC